jgi:hypothetical protein
MNHKIASTGDTNGLDTYRHLSANDAQESDNPSAFTFIDKRTGCAAIDPRVCRSGALEKKTEVQTEPDPCSPA